MKNAVFACMIFVASGSLYAVDFIRGDVNGDGVVSIADAYILFHYQERRSEIDTAIPRPVQCLDAADVDDNGFVDEIDYALIWGFASSTYPWLPEPPFPNAGRDPTTEEDLTCDSYGGGSRLRDPAAKLEIFHAYAPGGKNGHVVITVAVSSSTSIAAFQGKVLDHRGILADSGFLSVGFLGNTSGRIPGILDDLTGPFIKPWDPRSRQYRSLVPSAEVSQGRLAFPYI